MSGGGEGFTEATSKDGAGAAAVDADCAHTCRVLKIPNTVAPVMMASSVNGRKHPSSVDTMAVHPPDRYFRIMACSSGSGYGEMSMHLSPMKARVSRISIRGAVRGLV
jgi:hypothetical protein